MSSRVEELSHAREWLRAVQCIGCAWAVPVDVACLSVVSRTRALQAASLQLSGGRY